MHVVQTIRAEVRVPSRRTARAATERLAEVLRDRLADALAAQLETLVPESVTIRCTKLELDLGTIPARFDLDQLAERIAAAVRSELERRFDLQARPAFSEFAAPDRWPPAERESGAPRTSGTASAHEAPEAFICYLEHGALPWWFSRERWREEIPEALLETRALEAIEARLAPLAERSVDALVRLLGFPVVVRALFARRSGPLARIVRRFPATPLRLPLELACIALEAASPEAGVARPAGLAASLRRFLARQSAAGSEARRLLAYFDRAAPETESRSIDLLRSLLSAPERRTDDPTGKPQPAGDMEADDLDQIAPLESDEADVLDETPGTPDENSPAPDLLCTDSAGLVLLHPWLPNLFQNLGWLDEHNRFLPGRCWWAVQALFWLAHGRCPTDESEVVLEKTLCGIEPSEAAELPALDQTVQEELESLLRSVIANWPVLKNTSPDGLRESFLQRPGLLDLTARPPELRVGMRAYDLLLNRLPWSVDPVALPWRAVPLKVIWPTPA